MQRAHAILQFWFDGVDDATVIRKKQHPFRQWFMGRRLDDVIRQNFGDDLVKAEDHGYDHWLKDVSSSLALIILFDQFTRHIHRNTPHMYKNDHKAVQISESMIQSKEDTKLDLIQRLFLYMPLMHAEDACLQTLSVHSFQRLLSDVSHINPQNVFYYESQLSYAHKFFAIIDQFGRFPHRNHILNRVSTIEELEYLNKN